MSDLPEEVKSWIGQKRYETEGEFDESKLAELPVAAALIEPISDTADRWTR